MIALGGVDIKSKIQNPLTIIAIFAGIAEVAGTAVLLGLPIELQRVFVWFVMLFPIILVISFFLVLIFKTNVLYAPGDFSDEKNYMALQNGKPLNDATEMVEEMKLKANLQQLNQETVQEVSVPLEKLNELSDKLVEAKKNTEFQQYSDTEKYIHIRNHLIMFIKGAGKDGISTKHLSNKFVEIGIYLSFVMFKRITTSLIDEGVVEMKNGLYYYIPVNN